MTNTIYCAMWNLPGCLPEMEPFRTLNQKAAREFLADALEEAVDQDDDIGDLSDDDKDRRSKALTVAALIRSGEADYAAFQGYAYTIEAGGPIDDEEARRAALAAELGEELGDVEAGSYYGKNAYDAGGGEYLVLDDDEADTACAEYIRESVWAFNADFLVDYVPDGLTADDITRLRGDSCEDINDAFVALVEAGRGMSELVDGAIGADGRGHSLSGYDGEELELGGGFFAYRTN